MTWETQMLREIHRWYAYGRWANAHMLDAAATLDTEALARNVATSFGSAFGTLEHMYGADWIWMERWHGRSPSAFPASGTFSTVDALRAAWVSLDERRTGFLASLDDAALATPLRYRSMKGDPYELPLGQVLFHVSNHATYHRGQVMQLVKQLGGTVRSTDYFFWLVEGN